MYRLRMSILSYDSCALFMEISPSVAMDTNLKSATRPFLLEACERLISTIQRSRMTLEERARSDPTATGEASIRIRIRIRV